MINEVKPIGGYFELELPFFKEYHSDAIALNSGRFCLEYLLKSRNFNKIYVSYYTCDSVIEPINKLGIKYSFYHIDLNMHIIDNIDLRQDEAIIYTNYWGIQSTYCKQLADQYGKQLILDYTQAFYSYPIDGIDTFYSCRKFFGVPDGGYLYTDAVGNLDIEEDQSYSRINSLVKRIDLSPEAGYEDFRQVSQTFHDVSLRKMSKFTKRMMSGIDYERIAQKRIENYTILFNQFGGKKLQKGEVPMVFPYTAESGEDLRKILIDNKVFVAKYWPNVIHWAKKDSVEVWLTNHILPLPIDQRYGSRDIKRIVNLITA